MDTLKQYLLAMVGLVMVTGAVTLLTQAVTTGQTPGDTLGDTSATNTSLLVASDVNVVNTPLVDANQIGTWNVGVTNNATNPVPMRDLNNPARQPFQHVDVISIPDDEAEGLATFTVPKGHLLVIESIFLHAFPIQSGTQHAQILVSALAGDFTGTVGFHMPPGESVNSILGNMTAGGTTLLFSDGTVSVDIVREETTESETYVVTLSGYLVPNS